jgi:SagB-type dehydrogenase family enzyme
MKHFLPFFRALDRRYIFSLIIVLNLIFPSQNGFTGSKEMDNNPNKQRRIRLNPSAALVGQDLKSLLEKRYSCRDFKTKPLSLESLASILWATCGKKHDAVTSASRTIPSAGATFPLELFVVVGIEGVDRLKEGVYHYIIDEHSLELLTEDDIRARLCRACWGQDFIQKAPVSLVIAAQFDRTTGRYGDRGLRYVYMEAGHSCQNAYLAVTNLGLGAVEVGAFDDKAVKSVLSLDKDLEPLIVMALGYPDTWEK